MELFNNPAIYLKFLLITCSCILGFALFSEHVLHMAACKLCHYQQGLYASVVIILLIHLLTRSLSIELTAILTSLLFLVNMSIAGYQVLLEQHIIELPALCQKPMVKAQTIEELRAYFQSHPHVPCDEVKWSLWGISMAGYNVIINSILIFFNIMMSKRFYKGRP